jgi:sugar/nucleoside kinase (ribokinase family)
VVQDAVDAAAMAVTAAGARGGMPTRAELDAFAG